MSTARVVVVEANCPNCGSKDADVNHGNPLTDGVKCWDCGTVYVLGSDGKFRPKEQA